MLRVDGDCRVEIGEGNDQQEEDHIVTQTVIVDETAPETGSGLLGDIHECQGDKHQSLSEDDGHDACCIHLEGQIVTDTTVLFVAHHAFCILHRDAACALYQHDTKTDDRHHEENLDDEDDRTTVHLSDTSRELSLQCERQTSDDTNHNDHGDTIADTVVGDTLTEPHDEQGCGNQQDESADTECGEAKDAGLKHRRSDSARELTGELSDVSGSLHCEDCNGQITGDLVDFRTTALTFLSQSLEIGNGEGKQLHHDRCGDVRHDTQCEDGSIRESTTGEEVQHTEETFLCGAAECGKGARVNTGQHHMRTKSVNQDDEESVENTFSQILNPENVLNGFYEFFHCKDFLMRLLGCGSVNEFCRTAALFDDSLGLCRVLVGHHMYLSGEFALREDSDKVVLLGQTVLHEQVAVDLVNIALLDELLEGADVDSVILNTVDILETSLGQYSVDRHLTAFETDLTAVTGAGLCTLVSTCGSTTLAGALSSTDSAFAVC